MSDEIEKESGVEKPVSKEPTSDERDSEFSDEDGPSAVNQDSETGAEDGEKPTSKKLLVVVIAVIVLCIAGAAGYYGVMNAKAAEIAAYEDHSVAEIKKVANDNSFSVTLKPTDKSLCDAMGNEDLWKVTVVGIDIWSRSVDANIEPTPSATVDAFLRFVKSQDQEAVKLVYEGGTYDLTQVAWANDSSVDDPFRDETIKMREECIYPKMLDFDYTISGEKVNDVNATVTVGISTYTLGTAFNNAASNFMSQSTALALSGASYERINSLLIGLIRSDLDALSSKDYKKTTELKLHWNGSAWILDEIARSDDFSNVATGGLRQVVDTIQEAY